MISYLEKLKKVTFRHKKVELFFEEAIENEETL